MSQKDYQVLVMRMGKSGTRKASQLELFPFHQRENKYCCRCICRSSTSTEKPTRKAGKPPLPKGKRYQPPSFEKEKAYFQEVDSFELLEESPSPKKSGTWVISVPDNEIPLPYMSSVLRKWLIAKKSNQSGGLFGLCLRYWKHLHN